MQSKNLIFFWEFWKWEEEEESEEVQMRDRLIGMPRYLTVWKVNDFPPLAWRTTFAV